MLKGCRGSVCARLRAGLRNEHRRAPDELHLWATSIRHRGPGMAGAFHAALHPRRAAHDLRRRLQVRDALHVSDAAEAWIAVLENISSVRGRVFNLGGGPENAISLLELVDQIAMMRGVAPALSFDAWRPGDQPWFVSGCDALSSAVGWKPQIPLREGLPSLLEWLEGRFAPTGATMPKELRI